MREMPRSTSTQPQVDISHTVAISDDGQVSDEVHLSFVDLDQEVDLSELMIGWSGHEPWDCYLDLRMRADADTDSEPGPYGPDLLRDVSPEALQSEMAAFVKIHTQFRGIPTLGAAVGGQIEDRFSSRVVGLTCSTAYSSTSLPNAIEAITPPLVVVNLEGSEQAGYVIVDHADRLTGPRTWEYVQGTVTIVGAESSPAGQDVSSFAAPFARDSIGALTFRFHVPSRQTWIDSTVWLWALLLGGLIGMGLQSLVDSRAASRSQSNGPPSRRKARSASLGPVVRTGPMIRRGRRGLAHPTTDADGPHG